MNQKQLEIFTTLARTLNFSKTAEALYMSQTTVTLQIHSLEEELQAKLFERTSRSVRLTYAGQIFLEGASEILEKMQTIAEKTTYAAKGYTGKLKIGFADNVNATSLSAVVRDFSFDHSDIRIFIEGGYPGNLIKQMFQGEYDLIYVPSFRELQDYKVNYHTLASYRTVAAFHADHPFNGSRSLHFSDFEGEDFICVSSEDQNLDFTTGFLKRLNAAGVPVNTVARTDNIDTVFLMLDADMGITVLPEYFQGRFYGSSQIRTAYINEDLPLTDYLAVWKTGRPSWELEAYLEYTGYNAGK